MLKFRVNREYVEAYTTGWSKQIGYVTKHGDNKYTAWDLINFPVCGTKIGEFTTFDDAVEAIKNILIK